MGKDKPDWTYVSEVRTGVVQIDTSGGPVSVDATGSLVYVDQQPGAVLNVSGDVNANITNTELNVNVVNSKITVEPSDTAVFKVDVQNSTINVSGTVSVDAINTTVNVSGAVDANITNSSIAIENATDEQGNPIPLDINVTNSVLNVSGSVDANITNSVITVQPSSDAVFNVSGDVNITNSVLTVQPDTNAVFNVSGSVDANITNSTLDVNVTNSVLTIEPSSTAVFNVNGSVDVSGSTIDINTVNTTVYVQAPSGDYVRSAEVFEKVFVVTRNPQIGAGSSDQFNITVKAKLQSLAISWAYNDYYSPDYVQIDIYEPATGATYTFYGSDLFILSGYQSALFSGYAGNNTAYPPHSNGAVQCVFVDANTLGNVKAAGFIIRIPLLLQGSSDSPAYIKITNNHDSATLYAFYGGVFTHY